MIAAADSGTIVGSVIGAIVIILLGFLQVAYLLGKISAKVERNANWIDQHDRWHSNREGLVAVRPRED